MFSWFIGLFHSNTALKMLVVMAVMATMAVIDFIMILAGTTIEMQGFMNIINIVAVVVLAPYTIWSLKNIVSETKNSIASIVGKMDDFKEKVGEKFEETNKSIGQVELNCQKDINKVMSDQVIRITGLIEILKKAS